MSKETLLKYANSSQECKKKFFALRGWCDRQANMFPLMEVFDCIYDFANGDNKRITDLINRLTTQDKVHGRSSVMYGEATPKMSITRGANGELEIQGAEGEFTLPEKGQHQTQSPNMLRNDGQVKKNVINAREKLFDLGQEVREIYAGQSKDLIFHAMRAIKEFAKVHKIAEMTVVKRLKSGSYELNTSNGLENAIIVPKKKTIKLNESQLGDLSNATKLTEFKFYNNVQRFLSDLLKDPVGAKVPFLLQANNIARNYLLYHLKSNGIINRHQKISDTDSQGNPKTAKMIIKYSVPKKDFAKKMKKLFIDMVAKNVPEKIEKMLSECDGGGVMGGDAAGATSAEASGQFSQPLFGVQRRKMPTDLEEDTTTSSVGNYQYTVPFGSDEETRDRTPGFSVETINEKEEIIQGFSDQECSVPPQITMTAYKLVRLYPNPKKMADAGYSKDEIDNATKRVTNKVFPPYFNGNGWELGKWYTAGLQDIEVTIDDNTNDVVKINAKGRNPKGGKMDLSPNIGLHALSLPLAYDNAQGDKKNGNGYMPSDLVWAEVEINFEKYDENDYKSRIGSIGSKGVTRNSMYKELKQMSKDKKPFYRGGFVKGFNGKGGENRVTVYLSSDFCFKRILTQSEVEQICSNNGVKAINHEISIDLDYYFPNGTWKGQ